MIGALLQHVGACDANKPSVSPNASNAIHNVTLNVLLVFGMSTEIEFLGINLTSDASNPKTEPNELIQAQKHLNEVYKVTRSRTN